MVESGFEGIGIYITRRQNKAEHYITMRPILDFYEHSAWRSGARVSWRCWEQDGLDLDGANNMTVAAAASDREEIIGEEDKMIIETTTSQE